MNLKEIFVWLFVFIVGSLIVSAMIYPGSLDNLRNKFGSVSFGGASTFDVISNPEKYVGKEITLMNVISCFDGNYYENVDLNQYLHQYKRVHLG